MVSGAARGSNGAGRVATVTLSMLAENVTLHASVVLVGKRIGLNTVCYRPSHVGRGAACIAKCNSNFLTMKIRLTRSFPGFLSGFGRSRNGNSRQLRSEEVQAAERPK